MHAPLGLRSPIVEAEHIRFLDTELSVANRSLLGGEDSSLVVPEVGGNKSMTRNHQGRNRNRCYATEKRHELHLAAVMEGAKLVDDHALSVPSVTARFDRLRHQGEKTDCQSEDQQKTKGTTHGTYLFEKPEKRVCLFNNDAVVVLQLLNQLRFLLRR